MKGVAYLDPPDGRRFVAPSRAAVALAWIIAAVAPIAAGVGLFWSGPEGPVAFTTLRGDSVELFGRGLYRLDTLLAGAGHRGTDVVTLALALPLLVASTVAYRRGSVRGGLLLLGALVWFVYAYASYSLGVAAYNELFLVYVVLFSASLFALGLVYRSFDLQALGARLGERAPRRALAWFMYSSGVVTLVVWLSVPLIAAVQGGAPAGLDSYTTLFTVGLDLAVIVPLTFLTGVLVLRREGTGYLIASALLVFEAMLAPLITAQSVSQFRAGVEFTPGVIVGPILGFVVLALVALGFLSILLRAAPRLSVRGEPERTVAER